MKKQTVYIESSVISYLTSKPSRDLIIASNQQITTEWWMNARKKFNCVISDFVTQEVSKGDSNAASLRLNNIKDLKILAINNDINKLAIKYLKLLNIPEKSSIDAYHLALAIWYNVDFLMTWNCKHIANAINIKILTQYNIANNMGMPVICTPQELLEV